MSTHNKRLSRASADEEHTQPEKKKGKRAHASETRKAPPRSRRWAFTLFGSDLVAASARFNALSIPDACSYICFQREICPDTERPHLQGYVEFEHGRTLRGVKTVLSEPSVHLSVAFDSPLCNRTYCSKPGGSHFIERGHIPPGQGWRSDLEAVRESICGGVSGLDLWDAHFKECVKYHKSFDRYAQLFHARKRALVGPYLPKYVTYICGPTGSGKTSRAIMYGRRKYGVESVYVRPNSSGSSTDWYNNLQPHHKVLVFDEYRSCLRFSNLLRALDGYEYSVEVKGRTETLDNIVEIFITSNLSPHEQYRNFTPVMRAPFFRRINKYLFMDRWKADRCDQPEDRTKELTF